MTNPLLGAAGAAAVFGPQKGADADEVDVLESNLARLARLVRRLPVGAVDPATPGAGAAGGTGFGLLAWGATMARRRERRRRRDRPRRALAGADLVVTGEGRFDGQSAAGKAPTEVARRAAAAGVPVALVAGAIAGRDRRLRGIRLAHRPRRRRRRRDGRPGALARGARVPSWRAA